MKRFLLFWLLLGDGCMTYAQTITIVDQETGKHIEYATLSSDKPRASAITNAQGKADLSAFEGSEEIQIRSLGYKPLVKSYKELESVDFRVLLNPSNLNLDEVVVSGTRWRQTTRDVPSKIVSVAPRDVAFQNPQTAADLLGISGKVFIQKSQQGGGSPMIRGFATNRLLYTVDGVRMNTAIFRGGNIQNVINLDPFATESTEVLFGPGSVIYGSDAIGGVMSFQTLTPQFSLNDQPFVSGNALMRHASANKERTAHFEVNLGWKKWALVSSFSTWNYDHLKQGSHGPDDYIKDYYVERQGESDEVITQSDPLLQIPSAYSQINLMQKVRFRPNENWDLNYGFHYSETSPYGRYDRHNRVRDGTARYAEWEYGPQLWIMNNLSINHNQSSTIYDEVILRIALQSFEESRMDRALNDDERNIARENVEAYSINMDLIKKTGTRNTLYYGVEYVLNDVGSRGKVTNISTGNSAPGKSRYPNATWQSMGAYINDEYKVLDQLTLMAGVRYNQFILDADFSNNEDFYDFPFATVNLNNGAVTGSMGAVFRPGKDWVLQANLGTAFRSPNVDDVGKVFDSEPESVVVPNPNLKAEYAYNADLGIAKVFGDAVKLDVTGYYTILRNALVRRNFQLNGQDSIMYEGDMSQVQAIQNAASARVCGIQFGMEAMLPAGFSLSADLNYQQGKEELNDRTKSPSRHAAPFFGIGRLNYQFNQLQLQLYSSFQGEQSFGGLAEDEREKDEIYAKDSDGNNYAPAWYTLNFKAMYNITKKISINAGVENITDQRYRPYSSGISGAGRNFMFSIKAGF